MPPLRACRDKSDPTHTTVLRKTHGRSIPSTTPAGLRPTAPTRPPSCRLSAPPSGKSPIQGQRNGTFAGRSTCRHRPQIGKRGVISTIALSKLTGPNSLKWPVSASFESMVPVIPEIHRVLSRTITLQSVINNSGLAISPRMRPRIRSTAVGAVHSRRESMVVSGICRYCDSSMLSNPIT